MKKIKFLLIATIITALLISCGGQPEAVPEPEAAAPEEEAAEVEEAPAEPVGKICVAFDGPVDDKAFNQSAWEGAQEAAEGLNWDAVYLIAKQQTGWEKNLNEFLDSNCDLIVGVGWTSGEAIQAAAEANPDQMFQVIDYAYFPSIPNVWGQLYKMEEGAFLAGYLAAGMTKTGKIGCFGGMNIPSVADFFIGFAQGIDYYNQENGTDAQLLGWSNETLDGNFVGDFMDTEGASRFTESLMDEGCDIIFPQSGVEALAAAAAMKQRGGVMAFGADADQFVADTASGSVYLTTTMKNLGLSIIKAANQVADGTFEGGTYFAHLADGGLELAPFHDYDSQVPDELKAGLAKVKEDIISGTVQVENWESLSTE